MSRALACLFICASALGIGAAKSSGATLSITDPVLVGSTSDPTTLPGATAVAVSGTYAYTTAYYAGRLTAVDISDPTHPTVAGQSPFASSLLNASTVNIFGGYAYVASKNRNGPLGSGTNDDGTGNSLTILDIGTNPAQPAIVGSVTDPSALFGAYGITVAGNYAYVAAQGCVSGQPCPDATVGDAFSVIDITTPSAPTIVATLRNSALPSPWTGTGALRHVTAVAVEGNYAYVTAAYSNRLTVINISNPLSPTIVASLQDPTQLNFDVDVAVRNGLAYVADQASSGRLTVVDVTTPTSPHVVGSAVNPTWLSGGYRVRLRGNFAFVSAVNVASVSAVDISDPTKPRFLAGLNSSTALNRTTGLDLDATGRYVIASSPHLSSQSQPLYPPFALQPGGPTMTGTISAIDLNPTSISVTISPGSVPANPTTLSSASFSFSVNDSVSTVRCALDGAAFGLCTTPTTQTYNALGVGPHSFTVQAIDPAGNTTVAGYSWVINPSTSPTTPVLDNFNRANGAVGANWSLIKPSGYAAMKIVGNAAADNSASSFAWNYWNQSTFGPDAEAYVTVKTYGSNDTVRVGARVTGGNAHSGYYVSVSATGVWSLVRVDAGVTTTLVTGPTQPLANGDKVGVSVVGSSVTAFHFTSGGGWAQVVSYDTASDSTRYTAAGSLALEFKTSILDDFGGGTVSAGGSAPVNTGLPVVSGSAVVGQVLSGSSGSWSGVPAPSFAYAWQLCDAGGASCVPIGGATSQTYTLVVGDAGSTIRVVVTATNTAGSANATSAQTGVVQAGSVGPVTPVLDDFNRANGSAGTNWSLIKPSGFAAMKIVGNAAADNSTSQYAWNYWNQSSFGPDAEAYVTIASYGGDVVRVGARVTGGNAHSGYYVSVSATGVWSLVRVDAGVTTTLVTGPTQPLANGDKVGVSVVGSSVTAFHFTSGGGWAQVVSYDTASDSTRYTAAGSLALEFKTSILDDFGGGTVSAGGSAPVNTGLPVVSGSAVVGQVLSGSSGSWSGVPAPSFAYAWQLCDAGGANCVPIGGATSQTYTLVVGDAGSTIRVVVTATNTAGSANATSAQTGIVAAGSSAPVNTGLPVVSGSAVVGQVLSGSSGSWSGVPAPSFAYAWQLCDAGGANCVPIGGATSQTYTLVVGDAGSTIRVVVTATNTAGSANATSAQTGVVQAGSVGPVTPVLDDFNRANGAAGANWSLIKPSGFAAMKIVGNAAADNSASQFAWNYWNQSTFGPDAEAYVTIASYGAGDVVRVGARVTGGVNAYSGYFVSVSATGAWSIIRVDAGGSPITLASGVTQTLSSGDKISIKIVGSVVTAFHYTSGGGWVQVLTYDTASDSTRYTAAGSLALEFKTSTVDDFGGGTLP